MNETNQNNTLAVYTPMATKQIIKVALFGIVAGLIVWGLTYVLENYALKSLLCANKAIICTPASQYSEAIATILGAAIGLFVLVKLQVFRPLLVVIATVVSLWGLIGVIADLPWYVIGLCVAGLYMVTYLLFTWITRLRLFWLVVVLLLVLIVTIRLILIP